jgi:hypothetical protein
MNCPNCQTPSGEGKKFCADCGTPLDPQIRNMELFLKTQVEASLRDKFKDQKLVDIETSQAIAERLHGWAKMFAFFVGVPIALIVLLLGFAGFAKYSDFKRLVASIEEQVKPKIEQAKSDAEQAQKTAKDAKADAEDSKKAIESATVEVKKQLGSATDLTKNVKALSERVVGLEQQTSNQIKGSSQRVEERVTELNHKIDAAARDIGEQQNKLASTDELVKALFSKGRTEYFQTTANSPQFAAVTPSPNNTVAILLLESVPIYQTLEVKWKVFSQPRGSYHMVNNALIFLWGDPTENLKLYPLEITYVPDPTSKSTLFKTLTVKDNNIFADGTKLAGNSP